jgi:hypothetical protein
MLYACPDSCTVRLVYAPFTNTTHQDTQSALVRDPLNFGVAVPSRLIHHGDPAAVFGDCQDFALAGIERADSKVSRDQYQFAEIQGP